MPTSLRQGFVDDSARPVMSVYNERADVGTLHISRRPTTGSVINNSNTGRRNNFLEVPLARDVL
jgi:hypothetical protein